MLCLHSLKVFNLHFVLSFQFSNRKSQGEVKRRKKNASVEIGKSLSILRKGPDFVHLYYRMTWIGVNSARSTHERIFTKTCCATLVSTIPISVVIKLQGDIQSNIVQWLNGSFCSGDVEVPIIHPLRRSFVHS